VPKIVAERLLNEYPTMPCYAVPNNDEVMKLAAGWLIDQSGLKGYREGHVGVHDRQALVLVNHGGATGGEVLHFAEFVCSVVRTKFGVEITPEVNIL
jgi:UDP-N-acetylmuramate dehydrogenase